MLGRFVVLERGQISLLRQRCDALLNLGERLLQLLLARRVRRELELTLHLGPRKTERFDLPHALRVGTLSILAGLASFLFSFFHALGEAGFRVDEPFSGITHAFDYPCTVGNSQCSMLNAQCSMLKKGVPRHNSSTSWAFAIEHRALGIEPWALT
jgi:hypothetical protein